jgi:hypothetical protein
MRKAHRIGVFGVLVLVVLLGLLLAAGPASASDPFPGNGFPTARMSGTPWPDSSRREPHGRHLGHHDGRRTTHWGTDA